MPTSRIGFRHAERFRTPAGFRLIDAAGCLILPTGGQRRDAALQPDATLSERKAKSREGLLGRW